MTKHSLVDRMPTKQQQYDTRNLDHPNVHYICTCLSTARCSTTTEDVLFTLWLSLPSSSVVCEQNTVSSETNNMIYGLCCRPKLIPSFDHYSKYYTNFDERWKWHWLIVCSIVSKSFWWFAVSSQLNVKYFFFLYS